jgi:Tfp pilus assembly protein PilF
MKGTELFKKGQDLFLEKKFKECRELFSQAVDAGYDPISGHLSIGAAYLHERQYDQARDEFSKVLELDNQNDKAHLYRGISYMNKKDYASAITDLNDCIAQNKQQPMAYFARAMAESEAGQEQEAVEDFKRVVAISKVEVNEFSNFLGTTMTSFDRSMALLQGERGPLTKVLTPEELNKLKQWVQ